MSLKARGTLKCHVEESERFGGQFKAEFVRLVLDGSSGDEKEAPKQEPCLGSVGEGGFARILKLSNQGNYRNEEAESVTEKTSLFLAL